MSGNIPDYICSTCSADWSTENFTPDCPECGGAAMQIPCPFCKGKCGAKWDRSTEKSHSFSKAEWQGQCRLPEWEQKKIREQRIQDYENERNAQQGSSGASWWEKDNKSISRVIRIFVILAVVNSVRHCDDIKQFLGFNNTVERPIVSSDDRHIDIGAMLGFKNLRGKIFYSEAASTYSRQDNGFFELSETKSVFWSERDFDGRMGPRVEESDTQLPDKALGEYDHKKLIIDPNGNAVMKTESLRIDSDGQGLVFEVEAEVEFVKGQASDIENGNPVVLKYTKQGLRKLREAVEDQTHREIKKSYRYILKNRKNVVLTVEVTKMPNETMTIDGAILHSVADGPMVTEFKLINKLN